MPPAPLLTERRVERGVEHRLGVDAAPREEDVEEDGGFRGRMGGRGSTRARPCHAPGRTVVAGNARLPRHIHDFVLCRDTRDVFSLDEHGRSCTRTCVRGGAVTGFDWQSRRREVVKRAAGLPRARHIPWHIMSQSHRDCRFEGLTHVVVVLVVSYRVRLGPVNPRRNEMKARGQGRTVAPETLKDNLLLLSAVVSDLVISTGQVVPSITPHRTIMKLL